MKLFKSPKTFIFLFFILVILTGSFLLMLPVSWNGNVPLNYIDALFTSTSAVCVTGLTSVNTADYTFWGQFVIMLLIQVGGLGIITITTIYIVLPKSKINFNNQKMIQEYFLFSVESRPVSIVRRIIFITLVIELIGAVLLYLEFRNSAPDGAIFISFFHSISAFCNAGFSTFGSNLEGYASNPLINSVIPGLIIFGGLGYVVIQDVVLVLLKKKRQLTLYSKIMLLSTGALILLGALSFLILENNTSQKGFGAGERIMASFFQAVTPRTAGFDTINQDSLTLPSKLLTILLMFIGGGSGSTAGGIKVATFTLAILAIFRGTDANGNLRVFKRKINAQSVRSSLVFFIRAMALLFVVIFLVSVFEHIFSPDNPKSLLSIVFESFSAFGTVGLSVGITPFLSVPGKIIIICTMFFGRVGLITIAMRV
jgi:trk system potassium uptake protein